MLIAGIASIVILLPGQREYVQSLSGPASVLQAIWSVVAVFVAVSYPSIESETKEREDRQRNRALLRQIVLNAEGMMRMGANASGNMDASAAFTSTASMVRWNSVRDSVAAFPITGLMEASEVEHLMAVRAGVSEAASAITRVHQGGLGPMGATETMARILNADAKAAFEALTKTV